MLIGPKSEKRLADVISKAVVACIGRETKCAPRKEHGCMIRMLLACVAICIFCGAACASSIEHWTCRYSFRAGKEFQQEWTIADNRMFAPKGKGSMSLVYNNDQVAVAYIRLQGTSTNVLVLDKQGGKIIEYFDEITAGIDPSVHVFPCRQLD